MNAMECAAHIKKEQSDYINSPDGFHWKLQDEIWHQRERDFKAGWLACEKRSAGLVEALEYCFKHGYICQHDDSSWCDDKCKAVLVAKKALAAYRRMGDGDDKNTDTR